MKILVTGGAGFIGSHIADAYIKNGHRVFVVDNLVTGDELFMNPAAEFIKEDICSSKVSDLIKNEKFDIINHHAAQIDVRLAVEDPVFDAKSNILGSLNILEAFRSSSSGGKIIFASSGGGVYGEIPPENLPVTEYFPINPLSPYGAAKHAIEHYLFLYNKLYNLNYTILRYGNVYGERQGKKGEAGVVSIFARLMLSGNPVTIFGNGEQLRDYIHVDDIVLANMAVSDTSRTMNQILHFNHPCYNIGTGSGYSVNRLYEYMEEILNTGLQPIYAPERKGEIFQTYLDCSKAHRELKWKPLLNFRDGVIKTVQWFKQNKDKFKET